MTSRCPCLRDRRVFVGGTECLEADAGTSSTTSLTRGDTRGTTTSWAGAGLGTASVLRTVTATTGGNICFEEIRSEAFERSDGLGSQLSPRLHARRESET